MPDLAQVSQFLREFGLPLTILGIFGWLWLTGRVATKSELEFRERLRVEERESRVRVEAALAKSLEGDTKMIELLQDIEREVLRGRTPQ